MNRLLLVILIICFVAIGCSKSHSARADGHLNLEPNVYQGFFEESFDENRKEVIYKIIIEGILINRNPNTYLVLYMPKENPTIKNDITRTDCLAIEEIVDDLSVLNPVVCNFSTELERTIYLNMKSEDKVKSKYPKKITMTIQHWNHNDNLSIYFFDDNNYKHRIFDLKLKEVNKFK